MYEPCEKHQEPALVHREPGALGSPHGDNELLTQESVLGYELAAGTGHVAKQTRDHWSRSRRGPRSVGNAPDEVGPDAANAMHEAREHDAVLDDPALPFKSCSNPNPQRSCRGRDE
jgi:hypothetical protein